jgi:hypothetical protein
MGRLHVPTLVRGVLQRTDRVDGGWSAGFGPSCAPYETNVDDSSFRACQRRLVNCLRQHRHQLATTDEARAALHAAERSLLALPSGRSWAHTVRVDHFDLTFWVLEAGEAHRRGAVPKR